MIQLRLLDATSLLIFLQKEGAYEKVKSLFREAQDVEQPVLIHQMSVGEVFSITARSFSKEKAEAFLPLLEVLPIRIVESGMEDVLLAARLQADHNMGFVNALIAATAKKENAVLMTGNEEFRALEDVIAIDWLNSHSE